MPIDPARVAQLIVTLADGTARRGSGYRIGTTAVLTAAHVIESAESVLVCFAPDQPDEWRAEVSAHWADADSDLAVVSIVTERAVAPAPFARLPYDDAVLDLRSVGFPLWKLRDDVAGSGTYRDSHHAIGKGALLSNSREGTLEFTVTPPGEGPAGVSPWEGMSGAAVWHDGAIVGVVSKHHRSDGLGRLAVARLDRAVAELSPDRRWGLGQVVPALGPDEHLSTSSGLRPGEQVRTAYHELVRDLAPDVLLGRDDEIGELVRFCAGDEPYLWWQAGPWAGKSALLAHFATAGLGGVDIVSFFITSRVSGEADSDAFLMAMTEQLRAVTGLSGDALATAAGRRGQFLDLLRSAGEHSERTGRRLVVVVDGLDEDLGLDPAAGLRPIISLLPRQPPVGVRFVVASRPHRSLLDHLRADHPLTRIEPRRLEASPYAEDIEIAARNELWQLLSGTPAQRDLIGLITASGGGLTLKDLEQLTGRLAFELEMTISGFTGRSLRGRRGSADIHPDRSQVYLFAHETLRELAEQQLGAGLPAYRDQIHHWAESFRAAGWPADSPGYLFRGYPRLLGALGDLPRLTACALDSARHDRMQNVTGGDYLALSEVVAAQELNLAGDPDLDSALRMSMVWDDLTRRSSILPLNLPAVWAALGEPVRAEALARGLIGPERQARALVHVAEQLSLPSEVDRLLTMAWNRSGEVTSRFARLAVREGVVRAFAYRGDPRKAELLARTIDDDGSVESLLCTVVNVLAERGDRRAAEESAADLREPYYRAPAMASVGMADAWMGDVDAAHASWRAAERAAFQVTGANREDALAMVAELMARAGDLERAVDVARRISEPGLRLDALCTIASCQQGSALSELLLVEAEDIGHNSPYSSKARRWRTAVAIAAAAVDDDERVNRLIGELAVQRDHDQLAETLAGIGQLWRAGDGTRSGVIRRHAERMAGREVAEMERGTWRIGRTRPLVLCAQALVAIGEVEPAVALVTRIPDLERRVQALTDLAESMLSAGAGDRARQLVTLAEGLASAPAEGRQGDQVTVRVIDGLLALDDRDRAEILAGDLRDGRMQAATWLSIAVRDVAAGEFDRAVATLDRIGDERRRLTAVSELAKAMARAGQEDRAVRLLAPAAAAAVDDLHVTTAEPTVVAIALASAGRSDEAARLVRHIDEPDERFSALTEVIQCLRAEHLELARELLTEAEGIARELSHSGPLSQLAVAAAEIGDQNRCRALFAEAEEAVRREPGAEYLPVSDLAWLAQSMIRAGEDQAAKRLIAAAELLGSAQEPGYEGEEVLAVSVGIVGDFERAERLADAVLKPVERVWALTELAKQLAAAGEYARADDMAGRLAGTSGSASLFGELADLVLETTAEQQRWARRFVVRALGEGPWFQVATAVARLDRRAFYWAIDRQ